MGCALTYPKKSCSSFADLIDVLLNPSFRVTLLLDDLSIRAIDYLCRLLRQKGFLNPEVFPIDFCNGRNGRGTARIRYGGPSKLASADFAVSNFVHAQNSLITCE